MPVEAAAHRQLAGLVEQHSNETHGPISFQTLCSEVKRPGLLDDFRDRFSSMSKRRKLIEVHAKNFLLQM